MDDASMETTEHIAPSVAEMAEKQREENLARAKAAGYSEPAQPSRPERIAALIDSIEHAVAHNGPVTLAMVRELRALLEETSNG